MTSPFVSHSHLLAKHAHFHSLNMSIDVAFHSIDEQSDTVLSNKSMLIVTLDSTLEAKTVPELTKLEPETKFNLENKECYYSEYEHTEGVIKRNRTDNHLVNAFLHSYNNHLPLKLRPDDIHLALQSIFATCINNNPEKFRSLFVEHEGKKKLSVENPDFNLDYFTKTFALMMKNDIKDKDFVDHFAAQYTTTIPLISTVSDLMLMNAMKAYFSYECVLGCGIPSVALMGTREDWVRLRTSYTYLKGLFKDSELVPWFKHFEVVLGMLVSLRSLQEDGTLEAPGAAKELWKRVISYVPEGSGGQTILGGWIRLLVPYGSSNRLVQGLNGDIACLDLTKKPPTHEQYSHYKLQDKLAEFYMAHGWSSVPKSVSTTPASLVVGKDTYQVEFVAGFIEPVFKDGYIQTNIGLKMTENKTLNDESLKQAYLAKGVTYTDNRLSIPYSLSEEDGIISKLFDANWYVHHKDTPGTPGCLLIAERPSKGLLNNNA